MIKKLNLEIEDTVEDIIYKINEIIDWINKRDEEILTLLQAVNGLQKAFLKSPESTSLGSIPSTTGMAGGDASKDTYSPEIVAVLKEMAEQIKESEGYAYLDLKDRRGCGKPLKKNKAVNCGEWCIGHQDYHLCEDCKVKQ